MILNFKIFREFSAPGEQTCQFVVLGSRALGKGWGGGDRGVLTSRFPYPLIPVPALYILAPAPLHFFNCEILRNVA